jgi:hypothetical protein
MKDIKMVDKAIIEYIIKRYTTDLVGAETISKEVNLHPNYIRNIIRKNGIKTRPIIKRSIESIIEMGKLYHEEHLSLEEVAAKFGIGSGLVHRYFVKHNISRRSAEESHRKYAINEDFFDNIDTEEKAYFLGFLYADGCNQMEHNYTTCLALELSDKEILEKFAKLIYKDNPLHQIKKYDRTHETPPRGYTASFSINSKHICFQLQKLGCVSKKTFILTYPKWMPDNMHRHFIRGYFDGDGTINNVDKKISGCKIVSTKEFLEGIKNIVPTNSNLYKNDLTNDKNTYDLCFSGNRNIQKFLNWIYAGSTIYLDRKYKRYLQFIQKTDDIDIKMLSGTRGYPVSYLYKNYPDFFEPLTINDIKLDNNTVASLNKEEKEAMANDIFHYLRSVGFNFTFNKKILNNYDNLCKFNIDTSTNEISAYTRLGTMLCKLYCEDYFKTRFGNKKSIHEAFLDDDLLMKTIKNRLGLNWKTDEKFNISFASIIRGFVASSICLNVSMFKPIVAKYVYMKYSNVGDVVYDYSAGWGGRMLAAASCNRKYIGVDPLTITPLTTLKNDLTLESVELIDGKSEDIRLDENSIDFSFSSPPYFDLEKYSYDEKQAYANGEDYFYNIYWRKTLENIKYMLKPGKFFGVNISNLPKMLDITKEYFGDIEDIVKFNMAKNHMHRRSPEDVSKYECIYIFRNNKL